MNKSRFVKKLFLFLFVFIGCSQIKRDVIVADIDGYYWKNGVDLVFENNDSLSMRDVLFIFRYDNMFEYNDVKVLFSVTSPRGDSFQDTLMFDLKHDGTSIERAFVTDFECVIINNAVFDTCATYYFNIKPLMKEPLIGVVSVGVAL